MKQPTQNYGIMLDNSISALQQAYADYKQAVADNLQWTWIDDNGNLTMLDRFEERNAKIEELKREVVRLRFKVDEIKAESEDKK